MNMKTGEEIECDIIAMLRGSSVSSAINGGVYHAGDRPKGSVKEDITVAFVTGIPGEIQTGTVLVSLYVPDSDHFSSGAYGKDGRRCNELARLMDDWADTLTCDKSSYRFRRESAVVTEAEPAIRQHFIALKLGYEYYDNNTTNH